MRVLVTDAGENHALAATRSLGSQGVCVTACDDRRLAKSFYSTYCADHFLYPSPRRSVTQFIEHLVARVSGGNYDVLFPMTEKTVLPLSLHRNRVEAWTTLPIAPHSAIVTAFDKSAVLDLAERLGVPIPRTIRVKTADEAVTAANWMGFPCVIKPNMSEIMTDHGTIVATGKPRYVFSEHDLLTEYRRMTARCPEPLLQEFVPGEGFGVFALFNRGRPRAWFAHRRLRDVVPTGSGSAFRESVELSPTMKAYALRLLESLEWHGVAMVEFKLDSRDGIPKLMEINGRFWNSLPLAIAAGVDFPHLLFTMAVEGDVKPVECYRTGVRCRWLLGDMRHLIGVLKGPPRGWQAGYPRRWRTVCDVLRAFHPSVYDDDFVHGDLTPGLMAFVDFLASRVPGSVMRWGKT